jgi:hypothetical protein
MPIRANQRVALQVEIEVFHGFLFMESTRCVISVESASQLLGVTRLSSLHTAHQRILSTASCHDLNTGLTAAPALFSFHAAAASSLRFCPMSQL